MGAVLVRVSGQLLLKPSGTTSDVVSTGYSTDVTDEQWSLLEPLLGRGRRGPVPGRDRREVLNAVLYQARTGCQWRQLPVQFGSWNMIWRVWCRWRDRGV
jgi:putative transposase